MQKEDYFKYYIQGSDHYLVPSGVFDELFNEMSNWREESKQLKEKYLNAVADYEYEHYKNQKAIEYIEKNKFDYEVKERRFYMLQSVVPAFRLTELLKGQLTDEHIERLLKGEKNNE